MVTRRARPGAGCRAAHGDAFTPCCSSSLSNQDRHVASSQAYCDWCVKITHSTTAEESGTHRCVSITRRPERRRYLKDTCTRAQALRRSFDQVELCPRYAARAVLTLKFSRQLPEFCNHFSMRSVNVGAAGFLLSLPGAHSTRNSPCELLNGIHAALEVVICGITCCRL